MSTESASTVSALIKSRFVRGLLAVCALLGALYVVLQFFPVYHIAHERDETGGMIAFLKQVQAFQEDHLAQRGHYLGDEAWSEWPPGPFPSRDGGAWGEPTEGPWAKIPLRPKEPLLFKVRLRASDKAELAPKTLFNEASQGTDWYILQARADLDGDGVLWLIEMTSAGPFFYFENQGD